MLYTGYMKKIEKGTKPETRRLVTEPVTNFIIWALFRPPVWPADPCCFDPKAPSGPRAPFVLPIRIGLSGGKFC